MVPTVSDIAYGRGTQGRKSYHISNEIVFIAVHIQVISIKSEWILNLSGDRVHTKEDYSSVSACEEGVVSTQCLQTYHAIHHPGYVVGEPTADDQRGVDAFVKYASCVQVFQLTRRQVHSLLK
jgi:hypothetical protein